MNYKEATDLFARRPKGKDFKIYKPRIEMRLDDGMFVFHRRTTRWEQDPATKKYNRTIKEVIPIISLSPDNVLTLLVEAGVFDNNLKNIWMSLLNCSVYGDSGNRRMHKHKVRCVVHNCTGQINVPFAKGLQVRTTDHEVIYSVPDEVRTTNRKASLPVYKFTQQAVKVVQVLDRLEVDVKDVDASKAALLGLRLGDDEEMVADAAMKAYAAAKETMGWVPNGRWIDNSGWKDYTDQERAQLRKARLLNRAKKILHETLKATHGGFDVAVINHTTT